MLTAGFKYTPPRAESSVANENSSTGLFDMIEELEEKPIRTPL